MAQNNIKPSEVSQVLLQQLKDIDTSLHFEEIGKVLQVSDGVARMYGLTNAEAGELLEFESGVMGVVMNLEYYGPFVVVVDIANAECDLNGKRQPVPTNIVMTQVNELETKVVDSKGKVTYKKITNKAGFLTYKNNMTGVTSDFNIFVKAKVQYGFGYIDSEWITVPVKKTIGSIPLIS